MGDLNLPHVCWKYSREEAIWEVHGVCEGPSWWGSQPGFGIELSIVDTASGLPWVQLLAQAVLKVKWLWLNRWQFPTFVGLKIKCSFFQDGGILLVSIKIHFSEFEWFSCQPCTRSSQWSVPDFAVYCTLVTVFMKQSVQFWVVFV